MKKSVIVLLHLGYFLLYSFLLFFVAVLIYTGSNGFREKTIGFGLRFRDEPVGLIIENIVMNGPAAKTGKLHGGEVILKIAQGDSLPVDISHMKAEDIRRLLKRPQGTEARLTVKRTDGSVEVVSIVRGEFERQTGPSAGDGFLMMLEMGFIPGMIAFYIFHTLLFSRFLSKRKIFSLVLSGLLTSVILTIPSEIVLYLTFPNVSVTKDGVIGIAIVIMINALLNGTLGLVMRGFVDWYGDIKIKEDLGKKNHEMELALIKSQINPHFLFNTLNNIDVLILKDPPKASDYLNKLSDMLRFMLYETKTEKIKLSEELGYIEKYIALQKIRTSNPDFVNYTVKGKPGNQPIEPMLFIPFIENAFKHAENKNIENAVDVRFEIAKDKITFECKNHYLKTEQTRPDYGGLGNELIRKRLFLLYGEKHKLQITDQNQVYTVNITLDLL